MGRKKVGQAFVLFEVSLKSVGNTGSNWSNNEQVPVTSDAISCVTVDNCSHFKSRSVNRFFDIKK